MASRAQVNMRTSAEAEHARQQNKMSNPMFEADDLNSVCMALSLPLLLPVCCSGWSSV